MKDTNYSSHFSLNICGNLTLYKQPIVMGILNATPDSFYGKSRQINIGEALNFATNMIHEGADIIDIGGYSSRPGAKDISTLEEISRITPIISEIKNRFPEQLLSVDTFRTDVAEKAIEAGADLINDISGGVDNPSIYELASAKNTPYIMMHMRGTPQNMQNQTEYNNLLSEIIYYFSNQIEIAQTAGLKDIIIDPGVGFSKTAAQNYLLIKQLAELKILEKPILAGVSRKSLIYKTLNISVDDALNGTTALNTICLMNSANILRVHDVRSAKEAIAIYSQMY